MAPEKDNSHFQHDEITFATGEVGQERLDSHIRDDHNDPHKAALEDIDPDQKVTKLTWAAGRFNKGRVSGSSD